MTASGLGGGLGPRERFMEPVITALAELREEQCLIVTYATGSGKSSALTLAVEAFMTRNPGSRILWVTDTLLVTQQASMLLEENIPSILIRDEEEVRKWAYGKNLDTRAVVVVADSLMRGSIVATLRGHEFDLVIIDSSRGYGRKETYILLTRGRRVLLTAPLGQLNARSLPEGFVIKHATLSAPSSTERAAESAIRRHVARYQLSEDERNLVEEGLQFFSWLRSDPEPRALRAAESSRAAFSAALLNTQYRNIAPGAHRILDKPQPTLFDSDESLSAADAASGGDETLVPAWGIVQPSAEDQIDSLLNRFDGLGEDPKLTTLISIVERELAGASAIIVFTQSSTTADYVSEFLDVNSPGIVDRSFRKRLRSLREPHLSLGGSHLSVLTDKDLAYLTEAPADYAYIWFDAPALRAHGDRRLDFMGTGERSVYALLADPAFLLSVRSLRSFGFFVPEGRVRQVHYRGK
jgi:hypothetical protein